MEMHNWDNSMGTQAQQESFNTDMFWTVSILSLILLVFMIFFMRSVQITPEVFNGVAAMARGGK